MQICEDTFKFKAQGGKAQVVLVNMSFNLLQLQANV